MRRPVREARGFLFQTGLFINRTVPTTSMLSCQLALPLALALGGRDCGRPSCEIGPGTRAGVGPGTRPEAGPDPRPGVSVGLKLSTSIDSALNDGDGVGVSVGGGLGCGLGRGPDVGLASRGALSQTASSQHESRGPHEPSIGASHSWVCSGPLPRVNRRHGGAASPPSQRGGAPGRSCPHVCAHACALVHAHMRGCVHGHMRARAHMWACGCMCAWVHGCVRACVRVYVCVRARCAPARRKHRPP